VDVARSNELFAQTVSELSARCFHPGHVREVGGSPSGTSPPLPSAGITRWVVTSTQDRSLLPQGKVQLGAVLTGDPRSFGRTSDVSRETLIGMLDLKVGTGEYEALATCPTEETIMRGRRRGRPGPSSQGSASEGTASASGTASPESATLVDELESVEKVDASVRTEGATPAEESLSSLGDSGGTDHGEPGKTTSNTSGPADSKIETAGEIAAHGVDEAEPEAVGDDVDTGTTEEETSVEAGDGIQEVPLEQAPPAPSPTPAPTSGRQPQAASGNPLPRVLAVANQKGGVGKTTTSVNLGAALAELGFRVLVIDLDPQGNATTGLGIDARNFELSMYDVLMRDCSMEDCIEPTSMKNLFVAPATIALAGAEIELVPAFSRELKLKRAIESVIDDFDYVLIDCPPSLGLITVNALAAASEVLVPIQCEYYALEGLSQLMRNVHLVASNLNPRLDISTIVLTMYDARTKLADQVATEVREHFGSKVCRIVIPRTVRLSEAPSFGQPITAFDPASRGAIAYRELAKEVSGGTS